MYQRGEGKSAFDAKLPVDAMQVKFDSSFADTQLARNCFVGKTLGGETHDLAFAPSQNVAVQRAGVRSTLRTTCRNLFIGRLVKRQFSVAIVRSRQP